MVRPLPVLFVLGLVLAGCIGAPSKGTSSASVPTGPGGQPAALPLVIHKQSGQLVDASMYPGDPPVFAERYVGTRGAGEPTLGINQHGVAIFPSIAFDVAAGNAASTRLYLSKDGGLTWNDDSPTVANLAATAPASLDPYVYADPINGRLFTVDLYAGCSNASWSDNDGATWTTNPIVCGIPVNDHQTIAAGPPTTLRAVPAPVGTGRILYYCVNQVGASTCTHSLDEGLTWSAGVPPYPGYEQQPEGGVVDLNNLCGGLHGHIHASEVTGTLFVPKVQCGTAEVARSTDNGLTFARVKIDPGSGGTGHDGAVATDSKGNVYYFWLDGKGFPRLAVSKDDGKSWGPSMNVTAPGVTAAKFPAITAGSEGHVAVYYVGSTVPGGFDANATVMQNATWNGYATVSLNALSDDPVFASATINDPADPLKRGDCSGRCSGMFDFFDIQVHPGTGQMWATAVDLCNDACAKVGGTYKDPIISRGAVGVQVGGTLLGSPLPAH